MKISSILLSSLLMASSIAFGHTAVDQAARLKAAGLTDLGSGFYERGDVTVQVFKDGTFQLLLPLDSYTRGFQIVAIKSDTVYGTAAIKYSSIDPKNSKYHNVLRNGNGSGTSGYEATVPADLQPLVGVAFATQLASAGFTALEQSQTIWSRDLGDAVVLAFITENGKNIVLFTPANKNINKKIKNTEITGYVEKAQPYGGGKSSGLTVQNSVMKFKVFSTYGGAIEGVELLKDLKDVELKDLYYEVPAPAQDASGFQIGGVNPTSLILGLNAFNGTTIGAIEIKARKVPGCSHGDPLLAQGEDLKQILAADNDKVKQLGLTHQEIAKPLLYSQAMVTGGFGTKFKLHGVEYEVSNLMMPMCGSLDSPFNDKYGTSIVFPRVTNLSTQKFVDFSYLHPHLINQYGFYGSHANRSYVSPESILDVFEYLKAGH